MANNLEKIKEMAKNTLKILEKIYLKNVRQRAVATNQRGLGHPGNWPGKKTFGDFLEEQNWKSCLFGGENVALKSEQRDVALVAANQGGLATLGIGLARTKTDFLPK